MKQHLIRAFARTVVAVRHNRKVHSGSPPLYNLLALGAVIVGVAQTMTDEAPGSFTALTPDWADDVFMAVTALSGLLILAGLYATAENRYHATRLALSLHIERFGLSFLMTIIALNIAAAWIYNHGFPMTLGSVWQVMFWLWSWTRLWDIRKALKGLTR